MATYHPAKAVRPKDPEAQQVLTFELGNETYGFEILRVREIRGWTAVTRIPQAPPHMLGVLNLRGAVVPVLDLRMRFGLERADYTKVTVIIVVSVASQVGRRDVGVVVDAVSDVVDFSLADIRPVPDLRTANLGTEFATDYIRGLVPAGERMVVLIDIDRLIGTHLADHPAAEQGLLPTVEAA
jgi:purine-binding chemotaxis protein CheW